MQHLSLKWEKHIVILLEMEILYLNMNTAQKPSEEYIHLIVKICSIYFIIRVIKKEKEEEGYMVADFVYVVMKMEDTAMAEKISPRIVKLRKNNICLSIYEHTPPFHQNLYILI